MVRSNSLTQEETMGQLSKKEGPAVIGRIASAPGSPYVRQTTKREIERIQHPDGRWGERITETVIEDQGYSAGSTPGFELRSGWWEAPFGCLIWIVLISLAALAFG
jgi:hypothetical protein